MPIAYTGFWIRLKVAPRRRIKKEEKAKVVTSVWLEECIQFLAALAVLHYDDFEELNCTDDLKEKHDLKEKDDFILFFKFILGKTASVARN